jgi:G3E family GTPase
MSKTIHYVMIGGFLGAGKTTTIGRLAGMYRRAGLNVGIVTNDQAADLVDTHLLRSQGFDVGEVAGACFCCNFNELIDTVGRLDASAHPDVILAEPVGSCTDLVATVVQPLRQLYGHRFEVAPYAVILKPNHGRRILRPTGGEDDAGTAHGTVRGGFSPKAEYIFRKQLEEADLILINRIDELTADQQAELERLIADEQPDVPRLRISARTGEGFDLLREMLDQQGDFGRRILDLDYDIYAEGEAELGWLNASLQAESDKPFDLDELLSGIIHHLAGSLRTSGAETAHLKAIGMAADAYGVANLVGSDVAAELSLPSYSRPREAELVINARVAIDPAELRRHVESAVSAAAKALGVRTTFGATQSFRPGRPVPTHRFESPA